MRLRIPLRLITPAAPVFALLPSGALPASAQTTLDAVRARGELLCGVGEGITGLSAQNAEGGLAGFGVDFCRALAAGIFNDPSKMDKVWPLIRDHTLTHDTYYGFPGGREFPAAYRLPRPLHVGGAVKRMEDWK